MGFREPIFEGRFDGAGWSSTTTTGTGNWSTLTIDFRPRQPQRDPEAPYLRGLDAHAMASTDTRLALSPEVIHDANGYYRLFGFAFPFKGITIKQLRLAFHERDGGNSERMTYILTLLRNPDTRRQYNLVPIWERFLDKYFQAWLKERAIKEAARRNQMASQFGKTDAEELLKEWGYGVQPDQAEDAEQKPELPPATAASEPGATVKVPWMYSYYLWRSTCDDTERLARWQELLVQEFVRVGMRLQFAVGYMGRQPQEWVTGEVQNRTVLFLDEETEPYEELAAKAVASLTDGRQLTNG